MDPAGGEAPEIESGAVVDRGELDVGHHDAHAEQRPDVDVGRGRHPRMLAAARGATRRTRAGRRGTGRIRRRTAGQADGVAGRAPPRRRGDGAACPSRRGCRSPARAPRGGCSRGPSPRAARRRPRRAASRCRRRATRRRRPCGACGTAIGTDASRRPRVAAGLVRLRSRGAGGVRKAPLGPGWDAQLLVQVRGRGVGLDRLGLVELERLVDQGPLVQVVPVHEGHRDAGASRRGRCGPHGAGTRPRPRGSCG